MSCAYRNQIPVIFMLVLVNTAQLQGLLELSLVHCGSLLKHPCKLLFCT